MAYLNELSLAEQKHWQVHLNACDNDNTGSVSTHNEITAYLNSTTELPNIKHPAYFHDWQEKPELRPIIEKWDTASSIAGKING